jgi:hypothetical protein
LHSHKSRSLTSSPGKENALSGGKRKKVKREHNPDTEVDVVQDEKVEA